MPNFEIEYTTNLDDRHTIVVVAKDHTAAYLSFALSHPKNYIITDINQI